MGSQTNLSDLKADDDDGQEKSGRSSSSSRRRRPNRTETSLKERLVACFDRIAESLEGRGDNELAEIVRNDGEIMAQGLVSLTRPFTAIRTPLLVLVAIVEPALAFGRILRVLAGRLHERRARITWEREQAAQEAAQQ
jgi:hypothetical protein